MKTLKFHKTECGVDFLLNVLTAKEVSNNYLSNETYNTDFFEIIFFTNANGHMIVDHQKIEIKDHTVVFLSLFQKRQFFLEADNLEFTVLAFQEQFLNDFFSDKLFTFRLLYFYQLEYPLGIYVERESIERYCVLLSEIKVELLKTKADSVHIVRSIIYYLLQKLNREYAEKYNLALEKNGNNYAFLFKKMIEIHIKEKQRINDYAELLGISRISLTKIVKEQFNVTPAYLLKQRLLTEIKGYLMQDELSVAEIAYQLHFSEPNHLMRFFKSQTGMTTGEFLSDYQNGMSY
ncbi:AraC family transcriptional regulator [Epilithonimonas ginsengisoli]|uniref:AraC family transcriptional regulator n=1 Tax=Epilithonimonas ginsengisoli TaxID=1245592 RepID=A0ABU4JJZ6_9FLAO|nr:MULTISPECIES: AraC family transcriptional regulator [Chryseobacterium group]MBV6880466.1 AraC family transcriptional regulator [Epilithonimonas sp. FP105]MDW8550017.1 AraC family transcriptional regulator [Epilithonimonas ginsengisoli]OAH69198.1 AraC family transcriptional regulator [Chryseobacterium sp. FP211-J200]